MPSRAKLGDDLAKLSADLRKYADGKILQRELRRDLRTAAKDAVPRVRAAVLRIPSKGENERRGRPSLRGQIAKATRLRVRTGHRTAGVTVDVNRRRLRQGNLAAYMEGESPYRRWRHPVYGNKGVIVQQPAHPYFYAPLRPMEPKVRKDAEAIIGRIAKELER